MLGGPRIKLDGAWSQLVGPQSQLGGHQSQLGGPWIQLGVPQGQLVGHRSQVGSLRGGWRMKTKTKTEKIALYGGTIAYDIGHSPLRSRCPKREGGPQTGL